MTRIYFEIPNCVLANFSKLKNLQAPRFKVFRDYFKVKLTRIFIAPANTFDNVKGQFPIGFFIWDTSKSQEFEFIQTDIYNGVGDFVGTKNIWSYDNVKFINDWVKTFRYTESESIATIIGVGSDFQNQRLVRFGKPYMKVPASNHNWQITQENIIESVIYYTVRHNMNANWLNDRDQFLFPQEGWKFDKKFQNDCLANTLFTNNYSKSFGTNHWIPFTEHEVNAQEKFDSNLMTDFIQGKLKLEKEAGNELFDKVESSLYDNKPKIFSEEATAVFDAGRELWKYYHSQPGVNVNASLYDIREYFQGRNAKGRMNPRSDDPEYTVLIGELRTQLKILSDKITPKIYEYGFLKV